ncbi:MAG: hypothetical protein LC732_06870 [Acidobacteria bacterium]|nr:hypothetical protein [Acidobacteriota bacterium]
MTRLATSALLAVVVIATGGCGPSERDIALDLERRIVEVVGVEPTTREYLERDANAINDVGDTVLLTWEGIDLGADPGRTVSGMLRDAGLVITRTQTEPGEEDPRDGSWTANIAACDPDVGRAGVSGTIGTATSGDLVLLVEAGGPPATSGCVGLQRD